MNDLPRRILIDIIAQYGPGLVDEPRRVEGLLKDLCGENKREINTLMDAMRERVALDLRSSTASGLPPEVLTANLAQRLLDNRPMSEEMARWAVETWAVALGILLQPAPPRQPAAPPAIHNVQPVSTPPVIPVGQPAAPLSRAAPPAVPLVQPVSPPPRELTLTLAPGVDLILVLVPAGSFLMGSDPAVDKAALLDEKPQHKVDLDAFWIGKSPVINCQYQIFVQATGRKPPKHWTSPFLPAGKEQHPVVNVSWNDAAAFCQWANGLPGFRTLRLPGEAEWEKAARGTDGRIYPWGKTVPDSTLCNIGASIGSTTRVGQYSPRGDSPYGCADMSGNVWEWCADWYDEVYYQDSSPRSPSGPVSGKSRVVRGGSWFNNFQFARCASRGGVVPVDFYSDYFGFRLLSPGAS